MRGTVCGRYVYSGYWVIESFGIMVNSINEWNVF